MLQYEYFLLIFRLLLGALNGIVIVILDLIYSRIVEWVVENWENHMYKRELENSKIIKNIFFQFFTAYLNIFYYALYFDPTASSASNATP